MIIIWRIPFWGLSWPRWLTSLLPEMVQARITISIKVILYCWFSSCLDGPYLLVKGLCETRLWSKYGWFWDWGLSLLSSRTSYLFWVKTWFSRWKPPNTSQSSLSQTLNGDSGGWWVWLVKKSLFLLVERRGPGRFALKGTRCHSSPGAGSLIAPNSIDWDWFTSPPLTVSTTILFCHPNTNPAE